MSKIYEVNTRTARKPHKCYECGASINAKDTYYEHTQLDDTWSRHRLCVSCHKLSEALIERIDKEGGPDWVDLGYWTWGELHQTARRYEMATN